MISLALIFNLNNSMDFFCYNVDDFKITEISGKSVKEIAMVKIIIRLKMHFSFFIHFLKTFVF